MEVKEKALILAKGGTLTKAEIRGDIDFIIIHLEAIKDNCIKVIKQLKKRS